jgi:hypothetical protein
VNNECISVLLLSYLRKVCGYEHLTEPLDLATDGGEVLDLQGKPKEYASKYADTRGTFILVKLMSGGGFRGMCVCLHVFPLATGRARGEDVHSMHPDMHPDKHPPRHTEDRDDEVPVSYVPLLEVPGVEKLRFALQRASGNAKEGGGGGGSYGGRGSKVAGNGGFNPNKGNKGGGGGNGSTLPAMSTLSGSNSTLGTLSAAAGIGSPEGYTNTGGLNGERMPRPGSGMGAVAASATAAAAAAAAAATAGLVSTALSSPPKKAAQAPASPAKKRG